MHLEESNIRVAEYMTMLPDKKILEQKLQKAIVYARERIAIQEQANQDQNWAIERLFRKVVRSKMKL